MQIKVSYITANEIMEILGIGRSKAYGYEQPVSLSGKKLWTN